MTLKLRTIVRGDGLEVWNHQGTQCAVNKKDANGVYQIYINGTSITSHLWPPVGIHKRHKLQPIWHPSGLFLTVAVEQADYPPVWFATPDMIEGWIQCGMYVNMHWVSPDGRRFGQISDFGPKPKLANGYTGPAFTPDGTKAVWAEIIDGNIFSGDICGTWKLILADVTMDPNAMSVFVNRRDITPKGARWIEPGNFHPDGRRVLVSSDIGIKDAQGQDQYTIDIVNGEVKNLTNNPISWDEHGMFSPDGRHIFYMSSLPFIADKNVHNILFLKTEFMLMEADGKNVQQLTHFNTQGFKESNSWWRGSVAANGCWHPNGKSISAINLFFPTYEAWKLTFM